MMQRRSNLYKFARRLARWSRSGWYSETLEFGSRCLVFSVLLVLFLLSVAKFEAFFYCRFMTEICGF